MGFLTRAVINALSPEDPANPLQPGSWLMEALGAAASSSGIHVSPEGSLKVSAVHACVRVLIEILGSMPLNVHQRMSSGGTRLATENRLFPLLNQAPNQQMTQTVWIQAWFAQTLLWGNGYSIIARDGANRPVGFYPFPSDRTHARRVKGQLEYVTTATPDGQEAVIEPDDMMYIPYLSFDGLQGYSPIALMRQGLGLALAAERTGSLFFGRGSRPSGVLEVPAGTKLSKEAKENMRRTWSEATSGAHALNVALLEEGIKFNPMSVDPEDAQFIETRKYQDEDAARAYRVPPHMIGILDHSTKANIEQQSLELIIYTMLPWVIKFEQEINRKLFAGTPYFAKFNMDGLLRGDFPSRTVGYQTLRNAGIISANDARRMEGWNLIPSDEGGDVYLAPMNMVPLAQMAKGNPKWGTNGDGTDGDAEDPDANEDSSGDAEDQVKQRFRRGFSAMFHDAVGRTLNRKKRDERTVQTIWTPVMQTLAESTAALVVVAEVSEETQTFIAGYVKVLAHRAQNWKPEDRASIAGQEFDRAYQALTERI